VRGLGLFDPVEEPRSEGTEVQTYRERKLVRFPPEQVFSVIADVGAYPEFVPWCTGSEVVSRQGEDRMTAEMSVGFQLLEASYVSRITMERDRLVRTQASDSGLFEILDCTWRLQPGPDAGSCWIHFQIEFAFASALHQKVAALFLDQVAAKMIEAFQDRCVEVHG